MRAALYARVSKGNGRQTPTNQLYDLRGFATSQGWQVAAEFIDKETGASSNRPQFRAAMESASRREFDILLFWSLDRLSREGALPTLRILETLSGYGVKYRSFREQFIDSAGPFSEAVVAIMGTLAKMERTRISERTKAGLARARRAGRILGPPRASVDMAKLRRLWDAGERNRSRLGRVLGVSRDTVRRRLIADGLIRHSD